MRLLATELNFLALDEQGNHKYQESPFRPGNLRIDGQNFFKKIDREELLRAYEKFEHIVDFKLDGWSYNPEPRGDEQEQYFRQRFYNRIMGIKEWEFNGQSRFLLTTLNDLTRTEISFTDIPHKLARYAEYLVAFADAVNVLAMLKDKVVADHKTAEKQHDLEVMLNATKHLQAWVQAQTNVVAATVEKKGVKEEVKLTKSDASITKDSFENGWALLHPDLARQRIQDEIEYHNELRYFDYTIETLKTWFICIEKAAFSNKVLVQTYGKLS